MKTIFRFSLFLLVCLSAACAPVTGTDGTDPAPGPAAWIDAPLDNSSLPLAEYAVTSHASDPAGVAGFELSVNGQVIHNDDAPAGQPGQSLTHIQQPWQPAAPGVYLLALRARNAQGNWGPYAFAHVNVGGAATGTPTAAPTATLTMTPTTTLTPTPAALTAVGLQNTNCHDGPANAYENGGTLLKDQRVAIEGISADGQWVWVVHPNFGKGYHCWLYIPIIQVDGDLGGLPVIPAPPLPVATDRPTLTPTPTRHPLR